MDKPFRGLFAGVLFATMGFAFSASAADWVYDSAGQCVSNEYWAFSVSFSGNNLTVNGYTRYPEEISPLDFSQPVKSVDGATTYTIVKLNPGFANYAALIGDGGKYIGEIKMPGEGLTETASYTFAYCVNAFGDIVLPDSLTTMPKGTFLKTKITSLVFGKSSLTLDGNWQPHLAGCSALTNVVFLAGGNISIQSFNFFSGCSSLKDIDLSGVVSITNDTVAKTHYPHLSGCSSLTNVTFGANLAALYSLFFEENGNASLERVEFLGAPPAEFEMPYLNEIKNTQKVLTVIPADKKAEWAQYVTDPTFPDEATTWKAECLRDGCDPALRPIHTTAWKPRELAGWVYADGKISYGGWQFNATVSGTNLTIGACVADPGADSMLDLSKPIQDLDVDYGISTLSGCFSSYANKANLKTLILPTSGAITINSQAFYQCANLSGDLDLSAAVFIDGNTFKGSGISSVKFGKGLQSFGSGWSSGAFQDCASLEKIQFDPQGNTQMMPVGKNGFTFYNCASLEYADLSGVHDLYCGNSYNSLFAKCPKLSTVILSNLNYLAQYVFYDVGSSVNFHFYGAAPTLTNKVTLATKGGVTFVHLDKGDPDYAAQLASWDAMTEEGKLDYESTWKKSLLTTSTEVRPLVLVDHMYSPEPCAYFKATWKADDKTLAFYYDTNDYSTAAGVTTQFLDIVANNCPAWNNAKSSPAYSIKTELEKVVFDDSFANYLPTSCTQWFNGCTKLDEIEGIENLNTANCTSMGQMFADCGFTELDLTHFHTKKVTGMGYMLRNMKVTELDLSSFDTQNVTDMSQMLLGNKNLTTIYVSDKFVTTKVTSSSKMFTSDTALVGGRGTTFDSSVIDKTYARIDGGTSSPGYFTDKFAKPAGLILFLR